MPKKTIAAIVAGTGFEGRAEVIRQRCKNNAKVTLIREPDNPHDPNAIGVWLHYSGLFGLIKAKKHIGYIKASRAAGFAKKLDSGEMLIESAMVRSFDTYDSHPRVSLEIRVITTK